MILGSIGAMIAAGTFTFAEKVHESYHRFYRSVWAGRILSTVSLAWAAWVMFEMPWETPWGRCDHLKPLTFVVAPALIVAVPILLQDLLAARGLGGVLLLAAAPVLDAARCHVSPWSVVPVVVAYIMVIVGAVLVASPYRMYTLIKLLRDRVRLSRICAAVVFLAGVGMVYLGLFVY